MVTPTLIARNNLKKILLRVYRRSFRIFERVGVHVTPNHYSQPIPDTRTLTQSVWSRSEAVGIDFRLSRQIDLLDRYRKSYQLEFDRLSSDPGSVSPYYRYKNDFFEEVDAEILYCMVRDLKPERIVEIGSGTSTLISARALAENKMQNPSYNGSIVSIEPFPSPQLMSIDSVAVISQPVQNVDLSLFESLKENDILFIDSSHIAQVGSDVVFEFLEVLPRLRPGVMVHVHDIFTPYQYPRKWVLDDLYFWNEQYILQAFLCGNADFEVKWSAYLMSREHPEALATAFKTYVPGITSPGSFWFKRRSRPHSQ